MYWENLFKFGQLKPDPNHDGGFLLDIPVMDYAKIPGFSASQTGGWVKTIANDLKKYDGKPFSSLLPACLEPVIDTVPYRNLSCARYPADERSWGRKNPPGFAYG